MNLSNSCEQKQHAKTEAPVRECARYFIKTCIRRILNTKSAQACPASKATPVHEAGKLDWNMTTSDTEILRRYRCENYQSTRSCLLLSLVLSPSHQPKADPEASRNK